MGFIEYGLRFVAAGALVVAVTLFARKGLPQIGGIIMAFPVISLISLLMVEREEATAIAGWGLVGLIGTAVFLMGFVLFESLSTPLRVVLSLLLWVTAMIPFFVLIP